MAVALLVSVGGPLSIGNCQNSSLAGFQMSQGRRKAAIRERKKRVLADGLLGCRDCLIETTKTDECNAHSTRRFFQRLQEWALHSSVLVVSMRQSRQPRTPSARTRFIR